MNVGTAEILESQDHQKELLNPVIYMEVAQWCEATCQCRDIGLISESGEDVPMEEMIIHFIILPGKFKTERGKTRCQEFKSQTGLNKNTHACIWVFREISS